jgi:hypothetical protein
VDVNELKKALAASKVKLEEEAHASTSRDGSKRQKIIRKITLDLWQDL